MSRIAYVNGQYVPYAQAGVHVEDRGFQFADGVYEVVAVKDGGFVDLEGHLVRLERSLDELRIEHPMSRAALTVVLAETVRRNRVRNGSVYLQITRSANSRSPPVSRRPSSPSRGISTGPRARPMRPRASPPSRSPISAGAAATSRRSACCPQHLRSRPRKRLAPMRPGWWMTKAS